MRRYYFHQRNGTYYAELVTPEGKKLTARSTGKATESEALLVIAKWLDEGIPTKEGKQKPVETVIGLDRILKAIRKTDLDSTDAMKIVNELKARKIIDGTFTKAGKEAKIFVEFLEEIWDYTSSPYVKELLANKENSIHKRHCAEMLRRVHSFYIPYFKDRPLYSITRQDLKEFALSLAEPRQKPEGYKGRFAEKLSAAYRTKILITAKTALRWAFNEGLIDTDPTAGIKKITG
ncbi:MAG: integrase, partial [Treponema sp.]|nr:integrase [Treponema sp.]